MQMRLWVEIHKDIWHHIETQNITSFLICHNINYTFWKMKKLLEKATLNFKNKIHMLG